MKTMKITDQTFLKDVKDHQMTVLRDEGITDSHPGAYRHLHFAKPGTGNMHFDLVTWPGVLCYTGDMGTFVFRRTSDMFTFFRRPASEGLTINPDYWAEKVEAADRADGLRQYSPDVVREYFRLWLDEHDATPELSSLVEGFILSAVDDGLQAVRDAAANFEYDGQNPFQNFWEVSMEEFTTRFIWACYAIVWGVQQYDRYSNEREKTRFLSKDGKIDVKKIALASASSITAIASDYCQADTERKG